MSQPRCERASSEHADGLLALFESAGSGCFCNYWHFAGDKNAWLEQCYIKPELNRAALVARLAEPELCGVVGFDGAGVLRGWLKLMRAPGVPRLYDQRVYRNLPCFADTDRESTYAVGCCYISETERGRGLAKALLAAAVSAAQAAGASALEAFPRGAPPAESPPLRPDEVWMGPERLFVEAGFERVSDFRPYPVLRLHLPR